MVEDHAEVLIVTGQHLTHPPMLLPHGSVHAALHLVSDCLQLSDQALGLRLPLDHESVRPGLAAVVREAQKVERLRASPPSGGSVAGGEPPELDQPGLRPNCSSLSLRS